jgi:hypothetical protein
MAQTKTRTSGSGSTRPKKTSGASAKRSSGARKRSSSSRARSASKSRRSSDGAAPLETVKSTVLGGAEKAGDAIGSVASKTKTPALAGGAALAGLAGGLAIAARGGRRKVLGMPVPGTRRPLVKVKAPRRTAKGVSKDLMKAAGDIGSAGRQAGELASEVRLVRQQLESSRRRSPVEIVLEGLTSRRVRD